MQRGPKEGCSETHGGLHDPDYWFRRITSAARFFQQKAIFWTWKQYAVCWTNEDCMADLEHLYGPWYHAVEDWTGKDEPRIMSPWAKLFPKDYNSFCSCRPQLSEVTNAETRAIIIVSQNPNVKCPKIYASIRIKWLKWPLIYQIFWGSHDRLTMLLS